MILFYLSVFILPFLTVYVFFCESQASELIVKYDEHNLSNSFKFGVIYQKYGQVMIHNFTNSVNKC